LVDGLSKNPLGYLVGAVTPGLLPMGKDYLGDRLSLSLNSPIRHVHHVDKKIVLTSEQRIQVYEEHPVRMRLPVLFCQPAHQIVGLVEVLRVVVDVCDRIS
jgi:hypothetical protein